MRQVAPKLLPEGFKREAVNGVTAKIERDLWLRGHGRRYHLYGRVVPAAMSSYALPGGNAP